jgi:hypothetical protein
VSVRPVEGIAMKYNIISNRITEFNRDIIEFRDQADRALNNGWVPLGGVQITYDGHNLIYTQSFISETLNFSMQRVAR